jgi:hypothetical protein
MNEETIKRLGLATYDDLRYLLKLLNVIISLTDDTERRDSLLRCCAWVSSQSTDRMFSALMEGVDYTTMKGGE